MVTPTPDGVKGRGGRPSVPPTYYVFINATDPSGNTSAPVKVGTIHVNQAPGFNQTALCRRSDL